MNCNEFNHNEGISVLYIIVLSCIYYCNQCKWRIKKSASPQKLWIKKMMEGLVA